jgi:purine-binding chemotaxis protein CheW
LTIFAAGGYTVQAFPTLSFRSPAMPRTLVQPSAPEETTEAETPPQRMVVLRTGEHRFGVSIEHVREIIPQRPFTRLPGSASYVCGLINLRGSILTVLGLAARMGLAEPGRESEGESVVVLERAGRAVGLVVDEVERIVEVDAEALDASLETLRNSGVDRTWLRGLAEVEPGLLLLLDADEILRVLSS